MNILLIYPKYPDTFWGFKNVLKFVSKKSAQPPLGLLTVASMLPKKWNKKLIDLNVKELEYKHIEWADMVLISAMVVQSKNAQEIVNRCKNYNKKIVAGGPVFTTQHEKFRNIDHFIKDEAEITLPLFLKDLKKGNPKHIYTSKKRPDIKKTPIPDWSLIDFKNYASIPIQYSRGCPYNCEFCDIVFLNGRIPRTKTPKQMLNELQTLYNIGWKDSVFIVDDNFIGNKKNVKKMLPSIIEWQKEHKYPFTFTTEASVNLADDEELMDLMVAANFGKVFLGIETPNLNSLKECNKTQNMTNKLEDSIKIIQKRGIQVMGGFIVGFDNDTESIFENQIKFIQKIGVATAMVGLLNAAPQTRLWHRLKAEGRLVKDFSGENTDGSLNFIPKMGREKLIKGYKEILSTIYSPKNYYKRINTVIKNYKPTVKNKFSKDKFNAFIRSTWRIGILSRTRFLYWRLIIKTLLTKRKALPIAIELAIYFLHFDIVTRNVISVAY